MKTMKGFTLIELVIVIGIIIILLGLIAPAAQSAKRQSLIVKARATISSIETALSMFHLDIGEYPAVIMGPANANMLTCLTTTAGLIGPFPGRVMNASEISHWEGPYINLDTAQINGAGQIIDPWGNAYNYSNPGINHGTGTDYRNYVDISSNGPLATTTADDIVNWRK